MRTIGDIYEEYRIPPWLQLHQLRVGAVGKILSDARGADTATIVTACLLHDMGAIVKFDLDYEGFRTFLDPTDLDYWKKVQADFRARYGEKEHEATDTILGELGISEPIRTLLAGTGHAKTKEIVRDGPLERQIVEYADKRVGPFGIVSMAERLSDIKKRYAPRWPKELLEEREGQFDANVEADSELEGIVFQNCAFSPEEISDARVVPLIEELKKYAIV